MDRVPCKDGQRCVFRVVRVSGTIRKAEEEAIRNAQRIYLRAREAADAASMPGLVPQPPQIRQRDVLLRVDEEDEGASLDDTLDG